MAALGTIRFATIHCNGSPEGRDDEAASINAWDMKVFKQKSYHYIILLDGTVVENLPLNVRGAHVGGNNTGNIGICYVGGMTKDMKKPKDTRTKEQKISLRKLVMKLRADYPRIVIRGHNEWPKVAKACPSFSVTAWLQAGMPT
jgi:N-acetylmuramoyl-L-alanine amidase